MTKDFGAQNVLSAIILHRKEKRKKFCIKVFVNKQFVFREQAK